MNSIINGVSHVYLYCHWTGIDADKLLASDFRMLVQGDDNCMRHPGLVKFPWAEGMATLGFESEAIYRARLQEVEFCSSRIYVASGGVTFGPKPGRVLAKLGYIINPPQGVSRESMMRGVALGLKTTAYFIPPLRKVIDRILQLTEGHDAWYERVQFAAFSKTSTIQVSTPEVMAGLNLTYDWDYGAQKVFDSVVEKMQFGDSYSPIATLLLDRDCGGPQQIFGKTHPTFVAYAA
jgi:hypothetical protein